MSKLYIKQKVFSWKDKFKVFDEAGREVFYVEGKVFSIGKKLYIYNMNNEEIAFIHEKLLSFLPKYFIQRGGVDIAEVVKKITFLKDRYVIDAFGWEVRGKVLDHEYTVNSGDNVVATISKKWLTWGDAYEIDTVAGVDDINVLCIVLIIDAIKAAQAAAAAASN